MQLSLPLYDFAKCHSHLEETVSQEDVSWYLLITYIGKWYLFIILLIFGLSIGGLILAGNANIWSAVSFLAVCSVIGTALFFLQISIEFRHVRSQIPRKVSIYNGKLIVTTPKGKKIYLLKDCRWFFGTTSSDKVTWFSGLHRGTVIQTPETLALESRIACGHSEELFEHWRDFLVLAQIPEIPPFSYLFFFTYVCLGTIVGFCSGASVGYIFSLITKDELWITVSGFTGLFEGALVTALAYSSNTFDDAKTAYWRLNPFFYGIVFLLIGMRFGVMGNFLHAIILSAIHATIGTMVVWYIREKIHKEKSGL